MKAENNISETARTEKANMVRRLLNFMRLMDKRHMPHEGKAREAKELIESINNLRKELNNAYKNFEYADSQEVIDYYSYILKAHEEMYKHLLKKAKENGIKADSPEILEVVQGKGMD